MQIVSRAHGCILLKFYIKPQLDRKPYGTTSGCILLKFYIKPQRSAHQGISIRSCILLKFYIKPQPSTKRRKRYCVVSYWNSTSNHNAPSGSFAPCVLYLIEILHQTTTGRLPLRDPACCILLKFYIKPQRFNLNPLNGACCILLKFYIKPQLAAIAIPAKSRLYLIEILHQTTTLLARRLIWASCILLKFYIKPQQSKLSSSCSVCCILLKFYIKPQQRPRHLQIASRCILLKFYIKPQPIPSRLGLWKVVSYWNSTSNHNIWVGIILANLVVSYWNSTSNHNTT